MRNIVALLSSRARRHRRCGLEQFLLGCLRRRVGHGRGSQSQVWGKEGMRGDETAGGASGFVLWGAV
jgi:hypothetical protein